MVSTWGGWIRLEGRTSYIDRKGTKNLCEQFVGRKRGLISRVPPSVKITTNIGNLKEEANDEIRAHGEGLQCY